MLIWQQTALFHEWFLMVLFTNIASNIQGDEISPVKKQKNVSRVHEMAETTYLGSGIHIMHTFIHTYVLQGLHIAEFEQDNPFAII